jgi:hypothetical protein
MITTHPKPKKTFNLLYIAKSHLSSLLGFSKQTYATILFHVPGMAKYRNSPKATIEEKKHKQFRRPNLARRTN